MLIKREAESLLKNLEKSFPVITITGPRQSGKTTLSRAFFKNKPYVSLENIDIREMANSDPRGFLSQYEDGAILDEIQRCPDLFSYLQQIVDEKRKTGLFVLTGSQQFGLLSGVTQSLAGRAGSVQLLPFSYEELYGRESKKKMPPVLLDDLLFTGFYPPVHDLKVKPSLWYGNYVSTYIERDVRQLINVKDLNTFQKFLRMCAARTGNLLNFSEISNNCDISHNTVKSWISILEASYIIFLVYPFYKNFNKRIVKTPKLYFYDTGLLSWLLSVKSKSDLAIHPMRGNLFESYVISEMLKYKFNRGMSKDIYFFRDRSGNEVDIILGHGTGQTPIEVKSSQTINRSFFKSLKKWEKITDSTNIEAALIYGGEETLQFDTITVMPWRQIVQFLKKNKWILN